MSEPGAPYRSPYTPTPGSSTPGPEVGPADGVSELWAGFWVTIAAVAIIAAFGIGAWLLFVHH